MTGQEFKAALRQDLGVSMTEFARFIGRNINTVSRWCRGIHEVPGEVETLVRLLIQSKEKLSVRNLQRVGLDILLETAKGERPAAVAKAMGRRR